MAAPRRDRGRPGESRLVINLAVPLIRQWVPRQIVEPKVEPSICMAIIEAAWSGPERYQAVGSQSVQCPLQSSRRRTNRKGGKCAARGL